MLLLPTVEGMATRLARPTGVISSSVLLLAVLTACGGSSTPAGGGSSIPTTAATGSPGSAGSSTPAGAGSTSAAPAPNATESNPPGDIPDNQAFVAYSPPGAPFGVTVPEGWARATEGSATTFTDKLNSIRMETVNAATAPTVTNATAQELPAITSAVPQIGAVKVSSVQRKAGAAVLITYLADSVPNPVTNKVVRNAVERYEFWRGGTEVILTLTGAKNADNVDPWRIVTDSLVWK